MADIVPFATPAPVSVPPDAGGADAEAAAPDALAAGARGGVLVTAGGEAHALDPAALAERLDGPPLLLCHARSIARKAGRDALRAYDLLELFAFVHPAQFCRPTPRGLAEALGLTLPASLTTAAHLLPAAAARLLDALADPARREASDAAAIAAVMARAGWLWAPAVLAALARAAARRRPPAPPDPPAGRDPLRGLEVWHRLKEFTGEAPPPPPGAEPVAPQEARRRLAKLVRAGGRDAEPRPQQSDYASAVTAAFVPREVPDAPHMVLAEAGTGVGKTLGYLAPATLWAEKNKAPVWISTYTRNLQHQIDRELDRLHDDPELKARRVVLRKGRENYLCLLNLEEAVRVVATQPRFGIALGLMARWTAATRDGDMTGGDFPGWLADLVGRGRSLGLADRRGECIHSACPHYNRCFIEHSVRRARRAEIVIANHALVMVQAALGGVDDTYLPTRYVFDEGHHLFEAADSAFAGHLTGRESAELRRWVIGAETGRRSRARGLKRRVEGLIEQDSSAWEAVEAADRAGRALPGEGWLDRLTAAALEPDMLGAGSPIGPAEAFLALVRRQVYARAAGVDGPYGLETEASDPIDGLQEAGARLDAALERLQRPLLAIATALKARLDAEADRLDTGTRQRIDALARALDRRGRAELGAWRAMLVTLGQPTPADFVDWFGIERIDGHDLDIGYYRHWIDPTKPFAAALARHAHGMVVTSATLTDGTGDTEADWRAAERRTGALHLPEPALRAAVPSPFDYAGHTRVLVVRDVRKDDLDQVAAAYRALFLAAGGGALGLFTAITRLRAVHARIAEPIEAAGLPLLAQHLDGMDVGTLVEIFRGEEHACLLGTDAVRDGIDVPGPSLRLIVFDRVPWPRPTLLHRARRERFDAGDSGGRRHDDTITRLRLKQAYGRLVRRADDRGVFVLLDPMMPSRLSGAFPPGVDIVRTGLAEAAAITREFLRPDTAS